MGTALLRSLGISRLRIVVVPSVCGIEYVFQYLMRNVLHIRIIYVDLQFPLYIALSATLGQIPMVLLVV